MNILVGVRNFLRIVNDNWTNVIVILGLAAGIYARAKAYFSKSKDEQLAIAKEQIQEIILKKISDAEIEYENTKKSGQIKRSKVIEELYKEYPILSKMSNQAELTAFIDEMIDNALVDLRKIVEANKE